ncbi:transposase [Sinorhizobium meliloti]
MGTSPASFPVRTGLGCFCRCRERDFTLHGLVAELSERGLKVDYRAVWTFVHEEGLSYKKRRWSPANGSGPTSPATGHDG